MQQKELCKLGQDTKPVIIAAQVESDTPNGEAWTVIIHQENVGVVTMRTARGGVREFSKLELVRNMLRRIDIHEFQVKPFNIKDYKLQ